MVGQVLTIACCGQCLGLQSRIEGEMQSGLYSVDMSPAMEGVGNSSGMVHTVAFQDRGDAHNFSRLLEQESEKLGAEAVQVVPFDPKARTSITAMRCFTITLSGTLSCTKI